ncbi:MAG: C40 family peptidase [Streptosporangiales bacterium]
MVDASQVRQAIDFATAQVGKPYRWGATGPDAYDCSGLIVAAYGSTNIKLPRTTFGMLGGSNMTKITQGELQPGDLVFPDRGHVCMYLGHGQIVEAPHTGADVRIRGIYTPAGTVYRRITGAPAIENVGFETATSGIGGLTSGIKNLVGFVTDTHNWLRIGEFLLGTIAVLIALAGLFSGSKAGNAVKNTAKKAVTIGGILK